MENLETLGDLLALPGFRRDLVGPRKRGSTTEKGLDALPLLTPVVEFRPVVGNVPVARYFTFPAEGLGGRLGAKPFGSLTVEELELLRARSIDQHGSELFLDVAPESANLPPSHEGVAILGPLSDGRLGWWTWYVASGEATRVMGCLTVNGVMTDHPVNSVAVKLHNG